MRVSNYQFFQMNSKQMTRNSDEVNQMIPHLSSGLRVITAKDDSVGYTSMVGLNEQIQKLERFQGNMNIAANRNNSIESSFSNTEDLLMRAQELLLSANNGSFSDDELNSVVNELTDLRDELVSIANKTDEAGNYLFAGYQMERRPFALQTDGTVQYVGDLGERELQVDNDQVVATSVSGQVAFMNVPNVIGDFLPRYPSSPANESGLQLQKAVIYDKGTYDAALAPYRFAFTDVDSNDVTELEVFDNAGNSLYGPTDYLPGDEIQFNGINVSFEGKPVAGDELSMYPPDPETIDIFTSINNAIAWVESAKDRSNPEQLQVDYNHALSQLNESFVYMTGQRGATGNRLNMIERKDSQMADFKLILEQSKKSIEDLDYASASAEYSQKQVVLQASMQTFQQLSGLSLFNYL